MTMPRRSRDVMTVARLAGEIKVNINGIFKLGEEVGIHLVRGAAALSPAQAERIRERHRAKEEALERHIASLAGPPQRQEVPTTATAKQVTEPTGPQPMERSEFCTCCGLFVELGERSGTERCDPCEDHFEKPGESGSQRVARVTEHEGRLKVAYRNRYLAARNFHDRMGFALESRDKWQAALVETILVHEERKEGCTCGARKYPCLTLQTLEQANRGIARRVEELCSLPDDERYEELYRRP